MGRLDHLCFRRPCGRTKTASCRFQGNSVVVIVGDPLGRTIAKIDHKVSMSPPLPLKDEGSGNNRFFLCHDAQPSSLPKPLNQRSKIRFSKSRFGTGLQKYPGCGRIGALNQDISPDALITRNAKP